MSKTPGDSVALAIDVPSFMKTPVDFIKVLLASASIPTCFEPDRLTSPLTFKLPVIQIQH